MRFTRFALGPSVLALVLVGQTALAADQIDPLDQGQPHGYRPVCDAPGPEEARCAAEVVTTEYGVPLATISYTSGYQPADLASAYRYGLPPAGSPWEWNGRTVAIIDAFDNPSAEADLAVYRAQFGLPPCTSASGCFSKVNQRGGATYPDANVGWAREIALDLDMASAVCASCRLLLVEADSNNLGNLGAAVDTAAALGATSISNSYESAEFANEIAFEHHYNHPGTAITVSSGDSGYGVSFPAASRYVTAVGGTTLSRSLVRRGFSETAWSRAGSGCSSYVSKPPWQQDAGCPRRMVADVAAVADPNTGVAVYNSYGASGGANWVVLGGTSVGAPIIAGVYALAGNVSSVVAGSYPYDHAISLFDVTSGSNGRCTRAPYLCTGGPGYDGPTGMGTPNGLAAF